MSHSYTAAIQMDEGPLWHDSCEIAPLTLHGSQGR